MFYLNVIVVVDTGNIYIHIHIYIYTYLYMPKVHFFMVLLRLLIYY